MTERDNDEEKFNETLKRMLNTPPAPHEGKREAEERQKQRKADKGLTGRD